MSWIKVSAKTVADALMEASIQLGTSSDNIEYHVLEQGSSGFLGLIGAKKAVIEAKKKKTDEDLMKEVFGDMNESLKEEAVEKKPQKEQEQDLQKKPSDEEASKEVRKEAKREVKKEKKEAAAAKEPGKGARKENIKEDAVSREPAAGQTEKEESAGQENQRRPRQANKERTPVKEGGRNSRGGRRNQKRPRDGENSFQKKKGTMPEEKTAAVPAENVPEKTEEKVPRIPKEPADPEVVKKKAETFLKNIFRTMDMEVQIEMSFEEDSLSVNITGEEMGLLIGKRGQTLDSLQYLTSLVVNKGNAAYVRVKLDTEDYRNRRKATLENLARNIALKVRKTRRPVFLEPMNPYERRIIHSALQNDPYVTTHSEGDEPCRKVVVTLRKSNERYEKNRTGGNYQKANVMSAAGGERSVSSAGMKSEDVSE